MKLRSDYDFISEYFTLCRLDLHVKESLIESVFAMRQLLYLYLFINLRSLVDLFSISYISIFLDAHLITSPLISEGYLSISVSPLEGHAVQY